jgi:type II secretory pathway component PulJ
MNVRIPQTSAMLRSGRGGTIPVTLPRTPRSSNQRSAFTLLEVVLALSLAVILLGAIFTAMDQSWKMTSRGREEMERSQLARALMRKIAIDIRSIAYVPPPVTDSDSTSGSSSTTSSSGSSGSTTAASAASTASSSSSSGSTSSTTGTSSTTDSDEPSARSIGIRGNTQRIEMHISRARRDLEFSANLDGAKMHSHTSDLRVVTYQLAMPGVSIMPGGAMMQGLIRTEGDRMATQLVEEKGAAPTSLSLPQALAPEVATVQFRFFDGVTWFTVWDSEEAGRLPRAVEVIITFAPSQAKTGPALRVNVSQSTNTFRTVVLIPISDPLPAEFAP